MMRLNAIVDSALATAAINVLVDGHHLCTDARGRADRTAEAE